ncbi:hypothetical protein DL98DRAFT_526064 [Cadophora sp. DSE1049]|nr:hypothetical protein DL98DRAFT_526064 [Cadophora sp. DSE1049]
MCNQTTITFTCCQRTETSILSRCQDFIANGSCNVPSSHTIDPGPCAACLNLQTNTQRPQLPSGQSRLAQVMGESPADEPGVRSPFVEIPAPTGPPHTQWPRTASAWDAYNRMFSNAGPQVAAIIAGPTFDREEVRQLRQGRIITDTFNSRLPPRERGRHLTITIPTRDRFPAYDPRARSELMRDSRIGSARQAAGAGGVITRLAPSEEVPSPEESPLEGAIRCANAMAWLRYGF